MRATTCAGVVRRGLSTQARWVAAIISAHRVDLGTEASTHGEASRVGERSGDAAGRGTTEKARGEVTADNP